MSWTSPGGGGGGGGGGGRGGTEWRPPPLLINVYIHMCTPPLAELTESGQHPPPTG